MAHNPVRWFEIYVQDIERAKKFYQAVFEVEFTQIQNNTDHKLEMWQFPANMDEWGASGTLVQMEGVPSGGNSTLVYFGCKDCSVEESRVVKAGGSVHRSKISIGQYGFISLVLDTDKNMIGLHSME